MTSLVSRLFHHPLWSGSGKHERLKEGIYLPQRIILIIPAPLALIITIIRGIEGRCGSFAGWIGYVIP